MGSSPRFRERAARRFHRVISIPPKSDVMLIIPLASTAAREQRALASRASPEGTACGSPSTRVQPSSTSSSSSGRASSTAGTENVAEGDLHCCLEEILALAASDEVRGTAATRIPQLVEDVTRDMSELREERVTAEWLLDAAGGGGHLAGPSAHVTSAAPFAAAAASSDELAAACCRTAPANRQQSALLLCAGLAVAVASGAAVRGAREASTLADELRLSRGECRQLRAQLAYAHDAAGAARQPASARPHEAPRAGGAQAAPGAENTPSAEGLARGDVHASPATTAMRADAPSADAPSADAPPADAPSADAPTRGVARADDPIRAASRGPSRDDSEARANELGLYAVPAGVGNATRTDAAHGPPDWRASLEALVAWMTHQLAAEPTAHAHAQSGRVSGAPPPHWACAPSVARPAARSASGDKLTARAHGAKPSAHGHVLAPARAPALAVG
ncbi:hypothetical protein KFE25_011060 [Diacronema lutheri]|uniref:Uncharacterized protein n=1 Tax=Diacronema lutheri TaxID=2081491 RepID=A0A8J6C6D5_DIALT|nr:hypothetical protein KFE25_011060 [Diacronema lutheri]